MKHILSALLVAAATTCAHAQYFQALYGTSSTIENLSDGHNAYQGGNTGHFLVGVTDYSISPPYVELMAQRTDVMGVTAGLPPPYFNSIYILSDYYTGNGLTVHQPKSIELPNGNGFGIAGDYYDPSSSAFGVFYVQLSPSGAVGFKKTFFPSASFSTAGMVVTSVTPSLLNNNELYVTGSVYDVSGVGYVFILKLDWMGNMVWSTIYDLNTGIANDFDYPYDIVESVYPNGSVTEVMVVGFYQEPAKDKQAFLLRVDQSNGNVTSNVQLYGNNSSDDVFTSIINSANPAVVGSQDGYVIAGYSDDQGSNDFWQVAIDQPGNVTWSNLFDYDLSGSPTGNDDQCYDVIERYNSSMQYEYYMTGYTDNGFFGGTDMMVIKTDNNGNGFPSGQFTYGSSNADYALRCDQLNVNSTSPPDGLTLFGYSDYAGFSYGGNDHYLVKAYFNGITCSYDTIMPIQNGGPGFIVDYYSTVIDKWGDYLLDAWLQTMANELHICYGNTVAGGSNARQAPAAKAPAADAPALTLIPNPVVQGNPQLRISYSAARAQDATLRITDMLGRNCYESVIRLHAGDNLLHVPADKAALRPGTYMVSLKAAGVAGKSILIVR